VSGEKQRFFPGLEGLRGLSVVAVLFFHGGFDWAKGGFLGVSTFFTLSGFLITSNVLRQVEESGSIGLREFWIHRFRRLFPAAMAAILLAGVYTALAGDPVQRQNFAGDAGSGLVYIANWHFIFSGQSYADLFSQPSALLHFWSLAIEEQFYLVFPLLCAVLLVRARLARREFGAVLLMLTGFSLACSLFLGLSQNAIYLGTQTRAGEILLGAFLATVLTPRRVGDLATQRSSTTMLLSVLGVVAVVIAAVAWVTVPQSASWLYQGGFLAFALVSILLILGGIVEGSPLRRVLSSAPLRRIGLVSYGVYLYHWPIFLWLSPRNTGLSETVLFVPRVAISVGLAELSFRYLERPVKSGRLLLGVPARFLVISSTAIVILFSLAITVLAPANVGGIDAAMQDFEAVSSSDSSDSGLPRMAVFGDSTAAAIAAGLAAVGSERGTMTSVGGVIKEGCGIMYDWELKDPVTLKPRIPKVCAWDVNWQRVFDRSEVDLCLMTFGPIDRGDHRRPGTDSWLAMGDEEYEKAYVDELLAATDYLAKQNCVVVWVQSVPLQTALTQTDSVARQRRMNQLVAETLSKRPKVAGVVDFAGWYESEKRDDKSLRPDGTHFTAASAKQISEAWLSEAVLTKYNEVRKRRGN
jgi:peptidoglycan/LPS O-acetylase OafA/YrhL